MTYRTTFIASLSALALVLGASETFADPGGVRGAGVTPSRPAFPTFNRSMPHHHQHHHRGAGFGNFGVFYGLPDEVDRPVVEAPPLKTSDDLRFTCVYDIPWDYVHRCPQFR